MCWLLPHVGPGDVVAIAETPLPRQLCRGFHAHSSLASACGLQAPIDLVRTTRVLWA